MRSSLALLGGPRVPSHKVGSPFQRGRPTSLPHNHLCSSKRSFSISGSRLRGQMVDATLGSETTKMAAIDFLENEVKTFHASEMCLRVS